MNATNIDSTLDWQMGRADAPSWQARQPYWAQHRDGDGEYVITQTEVRTVTEVRADGSTEKHEIPPLWRVSWHGLSDDHDAIILPRDLKTSEHLDVVMAAAVAHHAAGRRANAWARYMRENDPPEVTQ